MLIRISTSLAGYKVINFESKRGFTSFGALDNPKQLFIESVFFFIDGNTN